MVDFAKDWKATTSLPEGVKETTLHKLRNHVTTVMAYIIDTFSITCVTKGKESFAYGHCPICLNEKQVDGPQLIAENLMVNALKNCVKSHTISVKFPLKSAIDD